jgi:tyrosine-specific transport protein
MPQKDSVISSRRSFFYALATLAGTIIGVGLFSLPYITAKTGFGVMLGYFFILGAVIVLIHLCYGEVTLRTQGLHRLPGYAEKYLGRWGKRVAFFSTGLGLGGALLAYLIVGGQFLFSLCQSIFGGSSLIYTLIFFSVGATLIYFGIKSIAKTEFFCLILFFIVLLLIAGRGFSLIRIENLFVFDSRYLFLPYGAVLFSLCGFALVPEIKEMLKDNLVSLKKIIFLAVLIPALTYLFFIFLILGLTGQNTSMEAISGLKEFLGDGLVGLALFFGVLTTFTSFITLGLTLKKVLWYDLHLKRDLAWALACFVPLILFLLGLRHFITVISLVGGVMLGISAIIIILIYLKAKTKGDLVPTYSLPLPRLLTYALILFFVLGIIYEIIFFIRS